VFAFLSGRETMVGESMSASRESCKQVLNIIQKSNYKEFGDYGRQLWQESGQKESVTFYTLHRAYLTETQEKLVRMSTHLNNILQRNVLVALRDMCLLNKRRKHMNSMSDFFQRVAFIKKGWNSWRECHRVRNKMKHLNRMVDSQFCPLSTSLWQRYVGYSSVH
jgi:hypothetical protein